MTLRIGDLVEHHSERWIVSHRHAGVQTVILRKLDGQAEEIPNDLDKEPEECKVIANLPTQWPFIAAPRHPQAGPIDSITLTRGGKTYALKPMRAWAPSEPLHYGGVIYFHPQINLRPGEVLVAHHRSGVRTRLNITVSYGTAQRRLAIEEARRDPPPPQTRYDHLLMDEEEEDV